VFIFDSVSLLYLSLYKYPAQYEVKKTIFEAILCFKRKYWIL